MKITERNPRPDDMAKLGDLNYGTLVRFQGQVYIKVNKSVGAGLKLEWQLYKSVLFNPRSGTLRQVHGDTDVQVREGELFHEYAEASDYVKN